MSLFSSIGDSLKIPETDSIGDDNAGLSAEQNNPLLSTAVLGMRTAYDGIHMGFSYVIKGKKSSLRQIRKYIDNWVKTLNGIVDKYKEMLARLDDISADLSGMLTLDFAKEAWEIIQDTPILRRYLGEANYWYLYDTLGLLATQSGSLSADALSNIKQAIKQAILAIISATDGLISTQSYLSYVQNAWGFLYLKCLSHVTLDSVLPHVTTAYWYKPTHTSMSNGTDHKFVLYNNPPGEGFVPLPIPSPNPTMVTRQPSYITKFDYQNPDTWYLNGEPYYLPNTMDLLHRAYSYWGSSYTDAIHIPNAVYRHRDYIDADGNIQDSPLRVGRTLHQLDTSKMSIAGSDVSPSSDGKKPVDIIGLLGEVFTPAMLEAMGRWDAAYKNAYRIFITYVFSLYDGELPKTITDFWVQHGEEYKAWRYSGTPEALEFLSSITNMVYAHVDMMGAYAKDKDIPLASVQASTLFDDVMSILVRVGHMASGYAYSLEDQDTFMVGPSFDPKSMDGVTQEQNWALGVPYVAYKVDTSRGTIKQVSSGQEVVSVGDAVNVSYPVDSIAFVMFPSSSASSVNVIERGAYFSFVAKSLLSTVTDVPEGSRINDIVNNGTVNEFMFPFGMEGVSQSPLGPIPEALHLHRSCGLDTYRQLLNNDGVETGAYLGNIFVPNGELPGSLEEAEAPSTFLDVYKSYVSTSSEAIDELADVVGYSIDHGREAKFPCFGVYGNLIKMASWNYKEMPYEKFIKSYRKIKSSSKLYYSVQDPSKIILYHSSYMSNSRQVMIAIYHDFVAKESKSYGPNDSYTYYVYPGESVSVAKLPKSGIGGFNLGSLLSINATSPSGDDYHYTVIKNPTPLSPKYVDPEEWSFMDVVYEMLLLARNLAGLCGDNGKRLRQLEDDLRDFGISTPEFVGELPENNGQYSGFKLTVIDEMAQTIEDTMNTVYEFRAKLIAATAAW